MPTRLPPAAEPGRTRPTTHAETYRNNWRRLGFTDQDFGDGGSDRLVDALVTDGDASVIRSRIKEHLDAAQTTSASRRSARSHSNSP